MFVSLSLATITVDYRQGEDGPLAGLGRTAVQLMAPLQRAVTRVTQPIGDFFSGLARLPSLERRNEELEELVASLRSQLQVQADLEARVRELEGLLSLQESFGATTPTEAALVIATSPTNFEWSITIDKGSTDGVSVDDPVIAGAEGDARLVGRVSSVSADAAVVQLVIDRGWAAAAFLPAARVRGVVEGQGDDDMTFRFAEPGAEVRAGDVVETSGYVTPGGQQGLYPPGLVIGTVSRTLPPENEVEAFILVRPAVDFSNMSVVLVLKTQEGQA